MTAGIPTTGEGLLGDVLAQAPEALVIVALSEAPGPGLVVYANRAFWDLMAGICPEPLGLPLDLGASACGASPEALWTGLANGERGTWEAVWTRPDGTELRGDWCFSPVAHGGPTPTHAVAIVHDVTDQRAEEERLRFMASHDALTGLLNRGPFEAILERLPGRAERGWRGAVVLVDIDRFKDINDRFGHGAGDDTLVCVAGRMLDELRPGDVVARLGGDEFGLILEDLDLESALVTLERLRRAVSEQPVRSRERDVDVTISVGVAAATGGVRPQDILAAADAALYDAKNRGRDRVVAANGPVPQDRPDRRRERRSHASRAAGQQRPDSHTRPLVRLRDGSLAALEVGECAGDGALLEFALEQLARDLRSVPLVLDVSEATIADDDAAAAFRRRLELVPWACSRLLLRVDERTVCSHYPAARGFMEGMWRLGATFVVSDFGQRTATFRAVEAPHVGYVELSPQLLRRVPATGPDAAIVEAVTALAHRLDCQVIAACAPGPAAPWLERLGVDFAYAA